MQVSDMANGGKETLFSMGDDTALAVLSAQSRTPIPPAGIGSACAHPFARRNGAVYHGTTAPLLGWLTQNVNRDSRQPGRRAFPSLNPAPAISVSLEGANLAKRCQTDAFRFEKCNHYKYDETFSHLRYATLTHAQSTRLAPASGPLAGASGWAVARPARELERPGMMPEIAGALGRQPNSRSHGRQPNSRSCRRRRGGDGEDLRQPARARARGE